jgi:hypothetical protein
VDLLDLGLGLLVRLVLGLLVALRVLRAVSLYIRPNVRSVECDMRGYVGAYLGLELLKLFVLRLAVRLYLLLGLISCLPYSLGSNCRPGGLVALFHCFNVLRATLRGMAKGRAPTFSSFLDNLGSFPLGLRALC